MKHITIKDVAKALNVSASTISRAFNDKYDIRPETRDRILKAAKEMGYSPNPIARKLTQQRTYNIGVVVPEFINPYFPEIIIGIQDVLLNRGYQVLIMQSNENHETELTNLKTLEDNFVDGIILSSTQESGNTEFLERLVAKGFPLVMFNRVNDKLPVSKVLFDDYKWSLFATEHLIQQGIDDIVHFSGPVHFTLSKNRIRGFKDAFRKYNKKITKEQVLEVGFLISDGEEAMEKLIKMNQVPKGIFCVNDPTAIGAMRVIKKHGLRIPQDVAIVGFTESPVASLLDPPLTSVVQPTKQIGEVAADLLLKQLESNGFHIPETIVLSGKLNVNESSLLHKT